jgi:hypothetical protein
MKKKVLKDIIYFLGRTTDDDNYQQSSLYIRLTASSTAPGISLITSSYPDTKWLFVHRHPDIVLQKLMNHPTERRRCNEPLKRNPGPHVNDYLSLFVDGATSSSSMVGANRKKTKGHPRLQTGDQSCAAYLATNLALAQAHLSRSTGMGMEVDSNTYLLDEVGVERIFHFLNIEVEHPGGTKRIQEQLNKRAAGRRGGEERKGEAPLTAVTDTVASATAQFSPYNRGEASS